jgi:hypothetical protein
MLLWSKLRPVQGLPRWRGMVERCAGEHRERTKEGTQEAVERVQVKGRSMLVEALMENRE